MALEFHPLSSIFPTADSNRLTKLAESIRRYGQHEPIVLYQGQILDGRNRYRACILIGAEPKCVNFESLETEEEPLHWQVKKNIGERSQLTKAQLAVVSLDVLNLQAKPPYSTDEIKEAAALTEAGWSSVERLTAIQRRTPGLIDQIRSGVKSISQASRDAGFIEYDHAPIPGVNEFFGKGDKFREATEPLLRYLNGWRGRGFEFRHVNRKEATYRLKQIDKLLEGLIEARGDLANRAEKPKLRH